MKRFNLYKNDIGKSKPLSEPVYIDIKKQYQRVFFKHHEGIEKTPDIVDNFYISNLITRVFSHNIYQTIDEKKASFLKEKIRRWYYLPNTIANRMHFIEIDHTLIKRSKYLHVSVYPGDFPRTTEVFFFASYGPIYAPVPENNNPLYYYQLPGSVWSSFQFPWASDVCVIGIRTSENATRIEIGVTFTPI